MAESADFDHTYVEVVDDSSSYDTAPCDHDDNVRSNQQPYENLVFEPDFHSYVDNVQATEVPKDTTGPRELARPLHAETEI